MKNIIEIVNTIVDNSIKKINDKIIGVNFLEKFKYILIDELNKNEINNIDINNIKISEDRYQNDNLLIKFEKFTEITSRIKYVCSEDKLILKKYENSLAKNTANENMTKMIPFFCCNFLGKTKIQWFLFCTSNNCFF